MARVDAGTRHQDLCCGSCYSKKMGLGETKCDKHGDKFIDWKCKYCCSVALFVCAGGNYFCDPCHNDAIARRLKTKDCGGKNCPLGIKHPPGGEIFPLGCGLCRSDRLLGKA